MTAKNFSSEALRGLSYKDIPELEKKFGENKSSRGSNLLLIQIREVVTEPMFLLLVAACIIYLLLGQINEGIMTIVAILIVTAISIFQNLRSSKALKALRDLTEPKVKVIRDGNEEIINSHHLLPGDIMIIEEGERIAADAVILKGNDLSVNEAIITGESLPADKKNNDLLYQGTVVQTGMCFAKVTATGDRTELGKIGKSLEEYSAPKTILQKTISKFVRRLAFFGLVAFLIIWILNFYQSGDMLTSLLFGLTLTMAAIPEEIPVAFSSFMALGAYRMSRLGIISRQPTVIENLGAVSVICLDKTGTITENKMEVESVYDYASDSVDNPAGNETLRLAVLASEENPFDEMEKAIIQAYRNFNKEPLPQMTFEYALGGTPPMMTHVYGAEGEYTVAAKGAPERILRACKLGEVEVKKITNLALQMASKGTRVIAVAGCKHLDALPEQQDDFNWNFSGLISLYDPPKKDIHEVFRQFHDAGIKIKILTGDYAQTALNIAERVGIINGKSHIEGKELMEKEAEAIAAKAADAVIFARMFPEAKLKVVEALKAAGEIVAMTGDGVNDAPALKAANIGIAMGKRGTEVARQASDIILTDDDLQKVAIAIRHGRRIFANLKKAVRYIISIHIPIILTASLPLLLGWRYPNIFTPVHVIFLELIMGPTCSIFFENEPEQSDSMNQPPRKRGTALFENSEVIMSVIQGLAITAATLALYYVFSANHRIEEVRSVVFTTLLMSNVFLTFANRSFTETISKTFRYRNNLVLPVFIISVLFILIIHLSEPIRNLFGMAAISSREIFTCMIAAFLSVAWFEIYKFLIQKKNKRTSSPTALH